MIDRVIRGTTCGVPRCNPDLTLPLARPSFSAPQSSRPLLSFAQPRFILLLQKKMPPIGLPCRISNIIPNRLAEQRNAIPFLLHLLFITKRRRRRVGTFVMPLFVRCANGNQFCQLLSKENKKQQLVYGAGGETNHARWSCRRRGVAPGLRGLGRFVFLEKKTFFGTHILYMETRN